MTDKFFLTGFLQLLIKFKDFSGAGPSDSIGPNTAQFETWIKVNNYQNTGGVLRELSGFTEATTKNKLECGNTYSAQSDGRSSISVLAQNIKY